MFEVPWLVRQAVQMLNVVEIWDDDNDLTINIKAGIVDIQEKYPWSGESVTHSRRDMKSGQLTGQVIGTLSGPIVSATWGDPVAGEMHDAFFLDEEESVLTQVTRAKRLDTLETFTFKTVYTKIGSR